MTPGAAQVALEIVPRPGGMVVGASPALLGEPLVAVDLIITVVAGLCLAALVIRWAVRRLGDPLAAAPSRPNSLREDALAFAVAAYLAGLLAFAGGVKLAAGEADSLAGSLAVGSGAQLAGVAACLYLAAQRFEGGIPAFFRSRAPAGAVGQFRPTVLTALVAFAVCPFALRMTEQTVRFFAPDYTFPPHPTIERLQQGALPAWAVAALWTSAVAIAPLAEEMFFRGIVQTLVLNVWRRRWLAIGLASLAFSAVHFPQPQAMPALAVLAVLLGYLYERTGSLVPPIVVHALFNLKTLIWQSLGAAAPT